MSLGASFSCDQFKSRLASAMRAVRTGVRVLLPEHHNKMKTYRPLTFKASKWKGSEILTISPKQPVIPSSTLFSHKLLFHFLFLLPFSFKHFQSDFRPPLCIDLFKSEFSNNIALGHLYQPPPQFSVPYFFEVPLAFQTSIHIF